MHKQSDKSVSISLLSMCVFSDCGWMWEGQKGERRSLSFLLGRGISCAYVQVCIRACEQWIWSTAVACGGLLNIQFSFDVVHTVFSSKTAFRLLSKSDCFISFKDDLCFFFSFLLIYFLFFWSCVLKLYLLVLLLDSIN